MAKSRRGRRGPIPAAMAPRSASPGRAPSLADLLPRTTPAANLESFLAEKPGSTAISPAQAREAHICTVEGARLFREGRSAQAIPIFERAIKLNPGVAAYHHNLGAALLSEGRLEQAIQPFAAALSLDPKSRERPLPTRADFRQPRPGRTGPCRLSGSGRAKAGYRRGPIPSRRNLSGAWSPGGVGGGVPRLGRRGSWDAEGSKSRRSARWRPRAHPTMR